MTQSNHRTSSDNGLVTMASAHSVEETIARLERLLVAKGVKLFAVFDHSGEAERAGLRMLPTKVLVFGSPVAGTPLMIAAPSIAIDLPLKLLVREDASGKVWITTNSPAYLQARHGLTADMTAPLAAAAAVASQAASAHPGTLPVGRVG